MAKDYIGYQELTDAALRGVVREALRRAEKQGLIASHHFNISFKTQYPGVDIPDFLREQYPEEMTIILQHQFWGLKVRDELFEVTLSFKKIPATLTIPFAALTSFMDPGVQFALPLRPLDPEYAAAAKTASDKPAKPEPPPAAPAAPEKPASPAEVVSLDAFRKK